MSQFTPSSGDLVYYNGEVLYFQPRGNSCLLYKNRRDIGATNLAKCGPTRRSIRKPTQHELDTLTIEAKSSEAPLECSLCLSDLLDKIEDQ